MEMLWLAKQFWNLGERELYEYIRFFTMSAADFLEDYFENDLIKAAMASPGIIGTALGVYSPGSAYILLHHVMGDVDGNVGAWGLARGGMGAISHALAGAYKEHGGEIRTQAGVEQILVRDGATVGVALENGDELYADIIVSNLDAKRTFTQVMDSTTCRRASTSGRKTSRSAAPQGKVNIALSGMPTFNERARQPLHQPRRPGLHGLPRDHGARLRLLEARALVRRSVHRDGDPLGLGPDRGAAGLSLDVLLRAVLPADPRRRRVDPGEARCLRRHGDRQDRALRAGLQGPGGARGDPHAVRNRERDRPHGGQHLPGRADHRPAAVQPALPGLRPVPHAPEEHVHVRLVDAPRRRRVLRLRRQRGAGDSARPEEKPNTVPEDDFYDE
jgi:hypothetical protein